MKDFWNSVNIFNKNFFNKSINLHFAWGIIFIFVFVFASLFLLELFTLHNAYITMPNVVSLPKDEAIKILKETNLSPIISDSLFVENLPPHSIIKQIPSGSSVVKKKRTVLLLINRSSPPPIEFPNIKNVDYQSACDMIRACGFYVKDSLFKDDLAKNLAIEFLYNGRTINVGSKIPLGSGITIVLGNGKASSQGYEWVPDLINLDGLSAKELVESLNLKIAFRFKNSTDQIDTLWENYFIKDQIPFSLNENGEKNKILQGGTVVVWLTKDKE